VKSVGHAAHLACLKYICLYTRKSLLGAVEFIIDELHMYQTSVRNN